MCIIYSDDTPGCPYNFWNVPHFCCSGSGAALESLAQEHHGSRNNEFLWINYGAEEDVFPVKFKLSLCIFLTCHLSATAWVTEIPARVLNVVRLMLLQTVQEACWEHYSSQSSVLSFKFETDNRDMHGEHSSPIVLYSPEQVPQWFTAAINYGRQPFFIARS